jgi:hypothetical protein
MPLFKKTEPTVEQHKQPTPVGRTQTLALTGFIVSFFESIIPIVLGHVALRNYKKEEDQTWRGFAVAALILGYVGLVIRIKIAALIIMAVALSGAAKMSNYGDYKEKNSYYHSCESGYKNNMMMDGENMYKHGKMLCSNR